jgi:hypothetical protein
MHEISVLRPVFRGHVSGAEPWREIDLPGARPLGKRDAVLTGFLASVRCYTMSTGKEAEKSRDTVVIAYNSKRDSEPNRHLSGTELED